MSPRFSGWVDVSWQGELALPLARQLCGGRWPGLRAVYVIAHNFTTEWTRPGVKRVRVHGARPIDTSNGANWWAEYLGIQPTDAVVPRLALCIP